MAPTSRAARAALLLAAASGASCHDISSFSTGSGSFEGPIVNVSLAGIPATIDGGASGATPTRLCLTLDTNALQGSPGDLSTNDGLFHASPMLSIPQIWLDPLSTLNFGEGRIKNLIYVVSATMPLADGGTDVFAIVSLMQSGNVEVRLLRGAPPPSATLDGSVSATSGGNLFAVFELTRQSTPC